MGIYIHGVEMPKDGEMLCINIYPDGKVCIDLDLECTQIATAVPVPPHGDLIARDALYTELAKRKSYGELSAKSALRAVANAPTIIPASEDGDGDV